MEELFIRGAESAARVIEVAAVLVVLFGAAEAFA